jgi:hypothetical protein
MTALRRRRKVCRQIVILFLSGSFIVSPDHLARRCHMPFDNPHETPFGDLELLRDARSHISDKRDWVQGRYRDGDRYCLVATLTMVAKSSTFHTPNQVERRLARLLAAQLPSQVPFWGRMKCFTGRQRLIWFNDCPGTKHEDVMALFDKAIDHQTSKVSIFATT